MSTDLANIISGLPVSKYDDKVFNQVATGSSTFLPRLMLFGSNSDPVKTEKVEIGYTLVEGRDSYLYLGREIQVLVVAWRPKALDMSGESIVTSFDPDTELFQGIIQKADSVPNSGCVYGPEYLVWIPQVQKFSTFLMGSRTARRESPKLRVLLGKAATLRTKLFSNTNHKWHCPEIAACSVPFAELPDETELVAVAEKFNNPAPVEVTEPAGVDTRAR